MGYSSKEKEAVYRHAYYLAHKKEIAAWRKAYCKDWRLANKEKIAAQKKAYYRANIKRFKAYKKTYNLAHKKAIAAQKKTYNCERKVRLWHGNVKTQREVLMFLRRLLAQTEKALRSGKREALFSLKKKYEQLATMVA